MAAYYALLSLAAVYILVLGVRHSRRQDRSHAKFNLLASLLEDSYVGKHAEEEPEAGTTGSGTSRRDSERG